MANWISSDLWNQIIYHNASFIVTIASSSSLQAIIFTNELTTLSRFVYIYHY